MKVLELLINFILSCNFTQLKDLNGFEMVNYQDCDTVNKQDSHTMSFPSQTSKGFF